MTLRFIFRELIVIACLLVAGTTLILSFIGAGL